MSNDFNRTSRLRRLGEPLFRVDDPEEMALDLDPEQKALPAPSLDERFVLRIPADIKATYQRNKQRTTLPVVRSAASRHHRVESRQHEYRPVINETGSGGAGRKSAMPAPARNRTRYDHIRPDQVRADTLTVPRHSRSSEERAPLADLTASMYVDGEPKLELLLRALRLGVIIVVLVIIGCAVILALLWMFDRQKTVMSSYFVSTNNVRTEFSLLQAAALPAPGNYQLRAAPSLSPEQIDQILRSYGSPAAGTGHVWYRLGLEYNIDPAFALAFFIHESGAGTNPNWAGRKPDGNTTHNVGNIICAGYPTCYGRFRDYPNWETGIADWYHLIDEEYLRGRGLQSVAEVIPIYAPAVENDVQGYINAVHSLVDRWRQGHIP